MVKVIQLQWLQLSSEARLRCCRGFAAGALALARSERPEEREHYVRVASEWLNFAKEIDNGSQVSGTLDPALQDGGQLRAERPLHK